MRTSRISPSLALLLAASAAGTAHAQLFIGNDLVSRNNTSDGVSQVLNVYSTDPVPAAGTIGAFQVFDQNQPLNFQAYVLRATGNANEYSVLFDSGSLTRSAATDLGTTLRYSVSPISVQAGDLIAHYGLGIPFDGEPLFSELGEDPVNIYFSSPSAPTAPGPIVLGSVAFPLSVHTRTYAFAAEFTAVPEPAEYAAAAGLALLAFGAWRRGRR